MRKLMKKRVSPPERSADTSNNDRRSAPSGNEVITISIHFISTASSVVSIFRREILSYLKEIGSMFRRSMVRRVFFAFVFKFDSPINQIK
jgi:hypothetical protein